MSKNVLSFAPYIVQVHIIALRIPTLHHFVLKDMLFIFASNNLMLSLRL